MWFIYAYIHPWPNQAKPNINLFRMRNGNTRTLALRTRFMFLIIPFDINARPLGFSAVRKRHSFLFAFCTMLKVKNNIRFFSSLARVFCASLCLLVGNNKIYEYFVYAYQKTKLPLRCAHYFASVTVVERPI